jgi:hypothetical protein
MKKLVLFVMLASGSALPGQVYTAGTAYSNHHDVVPDALLWYQVAPFTNNTYSLNIFGNVGPELVFTARGGVSSGGSQAFIRVRSVHPDVYVRFGRYDSVYVPADNNWRVTKVAKPLVSGETINTPGAIWEKDDDLYLSDQSGSGGGNKNVNDFVGGDKYLGLRFDELGTYTVTSHYGWVWIRCVSVDSCYVKEYSSSARVSALEETAGSQIGLYPNPGSGVYFLQGGTGENIDPQNIRIQDALGRPVPFTSTRIGNDLELNIMEAVPGVYLFSCRHGEVQVTRKLVRMQ